jgi:fumarate hydratase class I
MYEEKNTGSNLPAQVDLYATQASARTTRVLSATAADSQRAAQGNEYHFHFMAKGGGSANKTFLFQETKVRKRSRSHRSLACADAHASRVSRAARRRC